MATACFCGLPAAISVLMLSLIVLRDDPFFSGMSETLQYAGDSTCLVSFALTTEFVSQTLLLIAVQFATSPVAQLVLLTLLSHDDVPSSGTSPAELSSASCERRS